MSDAIDFIVTPYKKVSYIGVVTKVLQGNRYEVTTDSGKKLNVLSNSKWVLRSNVLVQNDRIVEVANRTVKPKLISV